MKWSMKTVATLYLLLVSDPLTCATQPAVDDSTLSTETHCPGSVVSFSLLCPFLYFHGFLVAMLYAQVRQKGMSIEFNLFGNLPCISTILFAICPLFVRPAILPFYLLFHQS